MESMENREDSVSPEELATEEVTQPDESFPNEEDPQQEVIDAADGSEPSIEEKAESALAAVIAQLQAELEAERARATEMLDKFQRTAAEFQNARRRQEKQMAEEIERASTHIIKRLLPAMDDFDLAFNNVPSSTTDEENAWLNGFRQIQKKLQGLLDEEGVVAMPADGPFDPMRHEAVTSEPSDSVESGHIISTLRLGYEHRGRVLRPALVRVAA
jgi:molecular chaperone GrpE